MSTTTSTTTTSAKSEETESVSRGFSSSHPKSTLKFVSGRTKTSMSTQPQTETNLNASNVTEGGEVSSNMTTRIGSGNTRIFLNNMFARGIEV